MPIAPREQASRSPQGRSPPATRKAAAMARAFCQGRIGETVIGPRFAVARLSPPSITADALAMRPFPGPWEPVRWDGSRSPSYGANRTAKGVRSHSVRKARGSAAEPVKTRYGSADPLGDGLVSISS